ncbi:hypothetical protein E4T40_00459 [Aureobasidium subglaciale]|nr:hypothetical protein E4T40_00459 [Aureobasidium subglaciale]
MLRTSLVAEQRKRSRGFVHMSFNDVDKDGTVLNSRNRSTFLLFYFLFCSGRNLYILHLQHTYQYRTTKTSTTRRLPTPEIMCVIYTITTALPDGSLGAERTPFHCDNFRDNEVCDDAFEWTPSLPPSVDLAELGWWSRSLSSGYCREMPAPDFDRIPQHREESQVRYHAELNYGEEIDKDITEVKTQAQRPARRDAPDWSQTS